MAAVSGFELRSAVVDGVDSGNTLASITPLLPEPGRGTNIGPREPQGFTDRLRNMKSRVVLIFLTLFAVSCGSSDVADPASADPTAPADPLGAGPFPIATLDITVTHPEADDIVYTISCLSDTATVSGDAIVDAVEACLALTNDEVRTRIVDGSPTDQMCTEIYGGPDIATIDGTLDGDAVSTSVDRSNGCGIDDWDRLLIDVLPPALGVSEPAS